MTTTLAPCAIATEIGTHAITAGWAETCVAMQRAAIAERRAVVERILASFLAEVGGDATSPHVWLSLPRPWRTREFESECRTRGVGVAAAELFAAGRSRCPQAVRLSLAASTLAQLTEGLEVVAEVLSGTPTLSTLAV